jgi:hypothetical protein
VLQRLKSSSNPIVLASYGPTGHGRLGVDDLGRALRLQEACSSGVLHAQHVLDLDVRIEDANGRSVMARVVCVPFGEDRYSLTPLAREIFTAHDIAELYRVRPRSRGAATSTRASCWTSSGSASPRRWT